MRTPQPIRTKFKIRKEIPGVLKTVQFMRTKMDKKIVFTNGCFDIFHPGHVALLERAKSKGDFLIVALNTDESVKRIKGDKRPIMTEDYRAMIVASLGCVDIVTFFDDDTPYDLIALLQPDVLVKGGDYEIQNIVGSDIVRSMGGKVYSIDYEVYTSSTDIIKTIVERYKEQ